MQDLQSPSYLSKDLNSPQYQNTQEEQMRQTDMFDNEVITLQ